MKKEHILVVEDDISLSEWISDYLIDQGFEVSVANRGDTAVELIKIDQPDLVLLDIMLPEKNGFDVCREVRQFYPSPILMMTACSDETDEVLGLELGADDYINKPVRPRALVARIHTLLKRHEDNLLPSSKLSFGQLALDSKAKAVYFKNECIPLSANEFDVLWLLASQAGEVVSRTELVNKLRGIQYDGFDRSIDIRISRIRKKLNDDPNNPRRIKTIRGKGYLFAENEWL